MRHRIVERYAGVELGKVGLVGDVADGTGHRARAKQGALRPGQHFDALQIDRIDIKVATRHRAWRIIEIERNVREGGACARNLQARRVGRHAADVDAANARRAFRCAHVGQIFNQLVKAGDVQLFQRLAAEGLNGNRNGVQLFIAARCGHDNVDAVQGVFGICRHLSPGRIRVGCHGHYGRQRGIGS